MRSHDRPIESNLKRSEPSLQVQNGAMKLSIFVLEKLNECQREKKKKFVQQVSKTTEEFKKCGH